MFSSKNYRRARLKIDEPKSNFLYCLREFVAASRHIARGFRNDVAAYAAGIKKPAKSAGYGDQAAWTPTGAGAWGVWKAASSAASFSFAVARWRSLTWP